MVKLKKYRIHKTICDTCKGNGYVKIIKEDKKSHVHQCWECDSEGEYYIHEPETLQPTHYVDPVTGDGVKLN